LKKHELLKVPSHLERVVYNIVGFRILNTKLTFSWAIPLIKYRAVLLQGRSPVGTVCRYRRLYFVGEPTNKLQSSS